MCGCVGLGRLSEPVGMESTMGGFRAASSPTNLHAQYLQQLFALQNPHVLVHCTCPLKHKHQCAVGLSSPSTNLMETGGVQGAVWEASAEIGVLG